MDAGLASGAKAAALLLDVDDLAQLLIDTAQDLGVRGPDSQFGAGLGMPSGILQMACCDVNSNGIVDVVDALEIAQFDAGLGATLTCQ